MSANSAAMVAALWLTLLALVQAWGFQGHQLTATIAESLLSPTAIAAIGALLPRDNLTTVATWADQIKRNPNYRWTSNLHYVNPEDDEPRQCSFDYSRDCSTGRCVVGAIFNYTQRLMDTSLGDVQRAEAIKFLVHFIGDLHQPLHVSGRDKGGNGAPARFRNAKTNLHSIWDSTLLKKRMENFDGSFSMYSSYLKGRTMNEFLELIGLWTSCSATAHKNNGPVTKFNVQSMHSAQYQPQGDDGAVIESPACPDQWAVGINAWNCKNVWPGYSPDVDLSEEYYTKNYDIVEQGLIMGGVRLAAVLNFVFAPPS